MNISLALMQSPLTSYSVKLTGFPGLHPRTLKSFSNIASTSTSDPFTLSFIIINNCILSINKQYKFEFKVRFNTVFIKIYIKEFS